MYQHTPELIIDEVMKVVISPLLGLLSGLSFLSILGGAVCYLSKRFIVLGGRLFDIKPSTQHRRVFGAHPWVWLWVSILDLLVFFSCIGFV